MRGYCFGNRVTISGPTDVILVDDETKNDDAFGRLRVSEPLTLFDFTSVHGKSPIYFDELVSGIGATSTATTESYINMVVISSGDSVIRQSKQFIPYQPGKSRLLYLTGVLIDNMESNVVSRIGSFDNSAGYFFEYSGGEVAIVERDNTSELRIFRNDWIDPLDGTGSSGIDIDFTKAQIFSLDQEWLGVGRVRVGLIVEGKFRNCFTNHHNSDYPVTRPYYRSAKLPIRFELRSNGGAGMMRMICGTVISEGGYSNIGERFSSKTYAYITGINTTTEYALISLKLRENTTTQIYRNVSIYINEFDIYNSGGRDVFWRLLLNPTLSSSPIYSEYDSTNSAALIYSAEVAVASGITVSNRNIVVASGFLPSSGSVSISRTIEEILNSIPIGRTISGDTDVYVLSIQRLTNASSISVYGNILWSEVR
jgi:hypothetical protein